jgi:hypothetical protein
MRNLEPAQRLSIDWDELELGLTWQGEDGGKSYLDRTTGQVLTLTGVDDSEADEEEIDAGLAEGRLIWIAPLESSVQYDWMAEFAESTAGELRRLLDVALSGKGAFRRFKEVLLGYPAERKRWFVLRERRLHEATRAWLADHGIEPTNDPPEREDA